MAVMNILIADDNITSCKLLRAILEAEGHVVIEAADGCQAIELLESHPIDAIISDLLMPNLDGYRLCRQIRQDNRWNKIPFICFTAIYGSQNDEKLALDLGANAYLRKPCSSATILSTLDASLECIDSGRGEPNEPHAELDVLNAYSESLVTKLQDRNFELTERSQLADLAAEIGMVLTHRNELGAILQTCSELMVKHLDAALTRIWTFNESNKALELRASLSTSRLPADSRLGEMTVGRIVSERKPYRTDNLQREMHPSEVEWAQRESVVSFVGYPLVVEDRLVGVVAIFARKKLPEPTLTTLAAIADCIALGIQSKWAEAVLSESEERFRQLAENISEVFWITDPVRKQVFYVSPGYETIWGRTCQSLLKEPNSFFEAIHSDDRQRVIDAFQGGMSIPYELEYRISRPDASVRWIRDRAFAVRDSEGAIIRIAGVADDITQKSQLEMQVRQSQKMLAMGRLAGGIAHDFNNELLVIFGHSELLEGNPASQERLRNSLAEINGAAKRAAGLTRQLLAFSRQQVIEPKVLELDTLLAESQRLLDRLIGEDVHLKMIFSAGLCRVNVDPGQIGQLLMNLALNARDAMPTGGHLTFETREVELDPDSANQDLERSTGRHVLLAVSDTGCGMSPEELEQIFEPFFTTKPVGQGTGLGLSVVEGIVKQSKGHIEVDSALGRGTTFNIYFPVIDEPILPTVKSDLSVPIGGKETILLVEDEDPVREVTASLLEFLGYRVLQVCSAEEALKLVRNRLPKIDLLLTDVVMPTMSGRQLAEALLAQKPELKVLFQSGYTDDMVVRHGILHAEVAFLQKPFTMNGLANKIREVLDQPRTSDLRKLTLNSWLNATWSRLNRPIFIEGRRSDRKPRRS